MNAQKISILKNQSGAALVIALVMMVVLTLIGLASIFSSTFEIKISGNKRGATDAFYAADSGVQATLANLENFSLGRYDPNHRYVDALNDTSGGKSNVNPTNAYIVLLHDTSQTGAPRRSGMSATHVGYVHFVISSTGQDKLGLGLNKSNCTIDEKVVRIIPSSE